MLRGSKYGHLFGSGRTSARRILSHPDMHGRVVPQLLPKTRMVICS